MEISFKSELSPKETIIIDDKSFELNDVIRILDIIESKSNVPLSMIRSKLIQTLIENNVIDAMEKDVWGDTFCYLIKQRKFGEFVEALNYRLDEIYKSKNETKSVRKVTKSEFIKVLCKLNDSWSEHLIDRIYSIPLVAKELAVEIFINQPPNSEEIEILRYQLNQLYTIGVFDYEPESSKD